MICYRDRTFCPFDTCKHFETCKIALTEQVKKDAKKWWGKDNPPIAEYVDKPNCYNERSKQ